MNSFDVFAWKKEHSFKYFRHPSTSSLQGHFSMWCWVLVPRQGGSESQLSKGFIWRRGKRSMAYLYLYLPAGFIADYTELLKDILFIESRILLYL